MRGTAPKSRPARSQKPRGQHEAGRPLDVEQADEAHRDDNQPVAHEQVPDDQQRRYRVAPPASHVVVVVAGRTGGGRRRPGPRPGRWDRSGWRLRRNRRPPGRAVPAVPVVGMVTPCSCKQFGRRPRPGRSAPAPPKPPPPPPPPAGRRLAQACWAAFMVAGSRWWRRRPCSRWCRCLARRGCVTPRAGPCTGCRRRRRWRRQCSTASCSRAVAVVVGAAALAVGEPPPQAASRAAITTAKARGNGRRTGAESNGRGRHCTPAEHADLRSTLTGPVSLLGTGVAAGGDRRASSAIRRSRTATTGGRVDPSAATRSMVTMLPPAFGD